MIYMFLSNNLSSGDINSSNYKQSSGGGEGGGGGWWQSDYFWSMALRFLW